MYSSASHLASQPAGKLAIQPNQPLPQDGRCLFHGFAVSALDAGDPEQQQRQHHQ